METKPKEKKEIELAPKKVEHKNIYAALSAFQGELKPMAKTGHVEFPTKTGGIMKFDYTPIGEIMETIYPILARHGLSVRHEITKEGVEAIVTHETYSETRMEDVDKTEKVGTERDPRELITRTEIRTEKFRITNQIRSGVVKIGQGGEMKDTGAAITYARRYTLTAVLGISSEEDKDVELLEKSAENAQGNVFNMAKMKLNNAKTAPELEKIVKGLQKDLKEIEAGKAPALGMKKDQYDDLLLHATVRTKQIEEGGRTLEPTNE